MSHLLIVLKAFNEVEHSAWQEYDEAYREKMASMGVNTWMWHFTKSCVGQDRNCKPLRRRGRTYPREREESGRCLGVVASAGSTMIVSVLIPHASFHMYVRYVRGTTLSNSALGGEKQTVPRVLSDNAISGQEG